MNYSSNHICIKLTSYAHKQMESHFTGNANEYFNTKKNLLLFGVEHYGALPEKGCFVCMCSLSLESPFWKLAHQIYPPIELTGIGEIGFSNDSNSNRGGNGDVSSSNTTNVRKALSRRHILKLILIKLQIRRVSNQQLPLFLSML